jgi:glutathione synthase/RimK-type ligase-like ATP-grasp enzyme
MYAILKNEFDDNHICWAKACESLGEKYIVVDITRCDWIQKITMEKWKGFLVCPSGRQSLFKALYDERLTLLNDINDPKLFFPSLSEVLLHENKKYLSYWLAIHSIPSPKTWVFYHRSEAIDFLSSANEEILVGKFNIGASGKGVKVLRGRDAQLSYLESAFSAGLSQNWGPNLAMGGWWSRLKKIIQDPGRIKKRMKVYNMNRQEVQKGFVLLQEFILHDFEWRIVRIGDSFFGHRKIKQGDKASGTKGIDYTAPDENLLEFVKELTDRFEFKCMAVDLFEDGRGGYLVNEMQCIFGHVQSFICELNGQPGRFKKESGKWVFENGLFNANLSYNLRLDYFNRSLVK